MATPVVYSPPPSESSAVGADPRPQSLAGLGPQTEEGLAQMVRKCHAQIENFLKALPVHEESIAAAVDALVSLDCPLPLKFSKINGADLIKKNKNIKGADSLPTLISSLNLLEKYGRNLLKPTRPPLWKCINFMNGIFKTRVDIIKGARTVLQLMGYSQVVENGLCFPPEDESPNMDTVAVVTADLAIARRETELYHQGDHPHAYRFRDCLEGNVAVIQVPGRSLSGRTKSVFMRRGTGDRRPTYENFDITPSPEGGLRQRFLDAAEASWSNPPAPRSMILDAPVLLGEPFGQTADTVQGLTVTPSQQRSLRPSSPTGQPVVAPGQAILNTTVEEVGQPSARQTVGDQDASDEVPCVMCNSVAASMQCSTCSGLRCHTCDEMWHQHRNRRDHRRQAVQPKAAAATESTVPCHICGISSAVVACLDCSSATCSGRYCSECDGVYHGHPQRKSHRRETLQARPAASKPQGIILSPVTSVNSPQQEVGNSSSLFKKRPVPAPRKSVHPNEAVRSKIQTKSMSDYVSVARLPGQPQRVRIHSAPAKDDNATGHDPMPSSDLALAVDRMSLTSEVESLLQQDIATLQLIQARQNDLTLYEKSSADYHALQAEIQQHMLQHNWLLSRQRQLESQLSRASSRRVRSAEEVRVSKPEPPLYDDVVVPTQPGRDQAGTPAATRSSQSLREASPMTRPAQDRQRALYSIKQPPPPLAMPPSQLEPPPPLSPRPRTPPRPTSPARNPPAKTQPEPVSIFNFFQKEEELMLKEKQKAKEEDIRRQALGPQTTDEPPSSSPSPTSPCRPVSPKPPPRQKRNSRKAQDSSPVPTTSSPATKTTSQGGAFAHTQLTQPLLEEKRRLVEQRAQSLDFIKMLKASEESGFLPEEVMTASRKLAEPDEGAMTELQWLESHWDSHVRTVTAMATNDLAKEVGRSVGMVRSQQAREALCRHRGDVQQAVDECVASMQTKVTDLVDMGFSHWRVCESLSTRGGSPDNALIKLQQERAAEFVARIWLEDDAAVKEKCIVDLGVDRHPDTVDRRLRMLLVEYELPSWGRAITAAQLIETGRYETGDAITAASECGDFERATQYLEKECKVCFSQFSMNKLSTLMHCQCMMCLECLHDHFTIVINTRNILNANCPACSLPDLRHSDMDHEATADYFVFLDILLKGILDQDSYQLFQTKLRDWNLMKEANFRWCAHCGNGFINDAPTRRKMRCNECNQLTCFQCKKPWMEQHENISCAEFQMWKEANDPNRAAAGLAIHLKENGIDCPHCKMRYELAKGGCMHFRCVQCTYEFCSGCSSPFKKVGECDRFASCRNKGMHAHHPRDCLYYLREQDPKALQKLLQKNKIDFKRDNPAKQQQVCNVMEQKELPDGLKDDWCGRPPVQAGLCNIHYMEYLVSQINQNYIDPATEMDSEELAIILQRNEIPVPAKDRESDAAYRTRLYQEVVANLPLEKKNPRDRAQAQ